MTTISTHQFDELATGAGKQTLLKTSLRCLVDFIAITDRKANILLSINTIIISIILTVGGAELFQNNDKLNEIDFMAIPILVILITCLVSSLLAIYAANPKQIQKQHENHLGILILGRNYKDVDAYLEQMAQILKSNEKIYTCIATDLHTVSRFLLSKNILLRKAYMTFFVGILVAVFSFIIIWLINY